MLNKEIERNYIAISEKIKSIFSHLEHISIFFKTEQEIKFFDNGIITELTSFASLKLSTLRALSLNYQWILPSEILEFYHIENSRSIQLDLLSEHENRTLILNFKSQIDGLNDLICLTFPKEIRFLGLYKTIKNLTTDDKIFIGELLHKLIDVEIKSCINTQKKQFRIAEYYKLKDSNNSALSSEEFYKYFEFDLNSEINRHLNRKFNLFFDKELIQYVVRKKYPIKIIVQYLTESFQTIELLEEINVDFTFQLFHFKLIENEYINSDNQELTIKSGNDKVLDLLDRLERAALLIENNGLVVNGKLIAQYLTPPVSPPAITEILKKNISKIENKFREYPSNWILIRKYLKPLRELEFKIQLNQHNKRIG